MKRFFMIFSAIVWFASFICAQDGVLSTDAGSGDFDDSGDGGPATEASLKMAVAVATLSDGSYLVVDSIASRVRKVQSDGVIVAYAGTGDPGYDGDEGPATDARLNNPSDIAVDSLGNVYIADAGNRVIRKVDISGNIISLSFGEISIGYLRGLAIGSDDALYIVDQTNGRVLKYDSVNGISIVAGDISKSGTNEGDGGPAVDAGLSSPSDVAVAADGTLYILEMSLYRIRKVNTSGVISIFAGTGVQGYAGDGGSPANAQFSFDTEEANKLDLTPGGKLFIADSGNNVVRCIDIAQNIIETISGTGTSGYSGDAQWALDGQHSLPYGIACFSNGDIVIADSGNFRVRRVCTSFQTPTGSNATVSIGDEVALNFSNVTSTGTVTVDVRDASDPAIPGDFQVSGGRYFDINVSAEFSGNVVITLAYTDTNPANETEDLENKVLHYTGTRWEDVTIDVRPSEDEVDGRVRSFSPFALIRPSAATVYVPFRRGDSNIDATLDISDAVFTLLVLFGGQTSTCEDAMDANNDADLNVTDAIYYLNYLFLNGPDIPPPGPELPGYDLSQDSLGCESYQAP